jgi:hypothetical protein
MVDGVVTGQGSDLLKQEEKTSSMTLSRIQELESLGFEWGFFTTCEDRLSELDDYREIHGHCNAPKGYITQLASWVNRQRKLYRLLLFPVSRHWKAWVLSGTLPSAVGKGHQGKGHQRNQT